MNIERIISRNGTVLLSLEGLSGEDDFYRLFNTMKSVLNPDYASYGVDSMCVDGSFRKNGLLVRMSSECVTDQCCFHYDTNGLSQEDIDTIESWIASVLDSL